MVTIIDPTDKNVAIVDGSVAFAICLAKTADPARPTIAELNDAQIVGYGNFG